jgi:hypothetical protein
VFRASLVSKVTTVTSYSWLASPETSHSVTRCRCVRGSLSDVGFHFDSDAFDLVEGGSGGALDVLVTSDVPPLAILADLGVFRRVDDTTQTGVDPG